MRSALIKIALFALFLAAPVAVLLLFGPADSYGRPQTRFPSVVKVLLGKQGRFDQFGDAVLERSDVRRLAIQLRNWTSYRIVGFVDTEHVVSGNHGWLFYRGDFAGGRCLDKEKTAEALRGLAVLVDLAQAAGIDMIVSLSPDKSTIYPEALNPIIRGYWKCRIENIAALRHIIGREVPIIIDHAAPLLAEKARNPDEPLYFATDTHWTPFGSALALRQLLAAAYPDAQMPPPRPTGSRPAHSTDLSRLLLLPTTEEAVTVEPLGPDDLGSAVGGRQTLIVHDSFYGSLRPQLQSLFSPAVLHNFNDKDDVGADAMAAERIIVNAVERTLLMRLKRNLSGEAALPRAIVARNQRRAEGCVSFSAGAIGEAAMAAEMGQLIAVRALPSGRLPCIRLSLSGDDPATLHLALPRPDDGTFEPGRAVTYTLAPGARTVALVLPAYTAGSSVQVSLEGAALSTVEIGEVADQ